MKALGFAHQEARDMELGRVCAFCGESFTRAHDAPTLCAFCHRRASPEERKSYLRAIHPESGPEAFAGRARTKRAQKKQRLQLSEGSERAEGDGGAGTSE